MPFNIHFQKWSKVTVKEITRLYIIIIFFSTVTLDHFWKCMLNSTQNVNFIKMQKLAMFITAICVLFFIKLWWPKNNSL